MKRYFTVFAALYLLSCQMTPEENFNRAKYLIQKKEYKLAINELNEAISKKPDYSEAYLEKGKCRIFNPDYYEANGDTSYINSMYRFAVDDFTKAIELNPSLRNEALEYRSGAYLLAKNYTKASEDLESLLKNDSSNVKNIAMLSIVKELNRDTLGVLKLHDSIIKKYPLNAEHYYGRAWHRLALHNDKKGACRDLLMAENLYNSEIKYYDKFLIENIKKLQQINCNK